MQSIKPSIQSIVASKPKLLIAISAIVMALLSLPAILPHINHPSMIYHIILHIVSLVIAIFLTAISALAYKRSGSTRILFMTFGFITLVVTAYVYLLNSTEDLDIIFIPGINIEISHIIMLVMVTFFGISFIKNPN